MAAAEGVVAGAVSTSTTKLREDDDDVHQPSVGGLLS